MKESNVVNLKDISVYKKTDSCSCLVQISTIRDKITEDIPRYYPSLADASSNKNCHPRQSSHRQVHFHSTEIFVVVHRLSLEGEPLLC